MYSLFLIALIFATFVNTSLGAKIGFSNPLMALFPMMVYLMVTVATKKMKYQKIPVYLLILAVIILLFKFSIGQNYLIEVGRLLLIPMFLYICYDHLTKKQLSTLRYVFIAFYILLCVLALVEKILSRHFFPVSTDVEWLNSIGYFRSASLLWHPLANGFFVAFFMAYVAVTQFKKMYLQIGLFFLGYVSLFCFDARGATIVVTLVVMPYFLLKLYRMAGDRRWMIVLGAICMMGVMAYLVTKTSVGSGRLMNADVMDNSSQTRLDVFKFYKFYKSTDDFIWGHPDNYRFMMEALGAGGVENGVITMILYYGIIFTPILLLLLFLLQYKSLSVYSRLDKWMLLIVFFGIGSMNPNLAIPLIWQLWIFTYFTFRPNLSESNQAWEFRL